MISIVVSILCIIFVYIADKYSDERSSNIWMLGPIGVWTMVIYWLFRIIFEFI